MMKKPLVIGVLLLVLSGVAFGAEAEPSEQLLSWEQLPPLPKDGSLEGMYLGVSNGVLIAAGGANYADKPYGEEGKKLAHDTIYVLQNPDGHWQVAAEKLPQPMAYGVSVSDEKGLVCIGGEDNEKSFSDVFVLEWVNGQIVKTSFPSLPRGCGQACGALLGKTIYVAGGRHSPKADRSMHTFWALDLTQPSEQMKWQILDPWPGPARNLAVAAVQAGSFFLFSGLGPEAGKPYLTDAYCYTPGKDDYAKGSWKQLADLPVALAASPCPALALGQSHIALLGGLSDSVSKNAQLPDSIYVYHTITNTWAKRGHVPEGAAQVMAPVAQWQDGWVSVGGQMSPGQLSPKVYLTNFIPPKSRFHMVDWAVLTVYLVVLVAIGLYFSKREKSTDDYFLAGRRVPWWAAGLSIYGTTLSALTFMATPAVTYATNWVRIIGICMLLPVTVVVIRCFLPFYRRLNVTTAYEYLEKRYNVSVRLVASGVFIISQFVRVAVVVYLPALALTAVTGMNVYLLVGLMGLLCIIYTVLGGIEAVIWTDVLQVIVLTVGALFCLVIVIFDAGGIANIISVAAADDKFHTFNWNWNITEMAVWIMVVSGFFGSLGGYAVDQSVVQRLLTTPDEKSAAKSMWTEYFLSMLTVPMFFALGTALYVFYKSHPVALMPGSNDAIVPWFIVQQLPVGIAGLVIAGLLAASMSSLDSAMHSAATTYVTDFHRRFKPDISDHAALNLARWVTVIVGLIGTAFAALLVGVQQLPIFDTWSYMIGLVVGGICGVFMLAVFSRRTTGWGALVGILVGSFTPYVISQTTSIHFFLYSTIGMFSCIITGYLASLVLPGRRKDITGLTIYTLERGTNKPSRV